METKLVEILEILRGIDLIGEKNDLDAAEKATLAELRIQVAREAFDEMILGTDLLLSRTGAVGKPEISAV